MTTASYLELYRKMGFNPFPLKKNSKEPAIPWKNLQREQYTGDFPEDCNIAIPCGIISDSEYVVDCDFEDLPDALEEFINTTFTVRTGRGFHFRFKAKEKLPKSTTFTNDKGQKIDILSEGRYVVAPPSIHPISKKKYEIISPVTSRKELDADALIAIITKCGFKSLSAKTKPILQDRVKEGSRHNVALSYANLLLFTKKLDEKTVRHELNRWNKTNIPPLSQTELEQIIKDAVTYHRRNRQEKTTDSTLQTYDESITSLSLATYQSKLEEERNKFLECIEENFPGRSFALEVGLSVKAQMQIEGISQPFTLIFMGNPSTLKSTTLEILNSLPNCYMSDRFTPRSFVSHSANTKKEDLEKTDLLPRLKHKTLITPELAPMFSGNQDELVEYFGMLTRILDGRGFQSDSGVHGSRGYTGDYYFTWIGAVIDIPHRVWNLLGNLGPKIYFFRLPEDKKSGTEKLNQIKKILKANSYLSKLHSSKNIIKEFWHLVENRPEMVNGKVIWDKKRDDEETLDKIVGMAMVLANLRGSIPTWHARDSDSGGTMYNFETPIIEDPSRASSALFDLARGHALLYGRNFITSDDLRVVIPTALSSAPKERVDLLRLLIENDGKLTTEQFMSYARVSRATALKEMEKLCRLGLVNRSEQESNTKPMMIVKLKDQFSWFLTLEFKGYWNEFKSSLIPRMSKLSQNSGKENLDKSGVRKGLDLY